MKNSELQTCVLGSVSTNCYLLKNKNTGELLIVDPADHAQEIFSNKGNAGEACCNSFNPWSL